MRPDPFSLDTYLVRRKILKILGAAFHVYDAAGNVVAYSKMKAFKLKEDIRLYSGEDMGRELLSIQARAIIDFSAAYDVCDARLQEKVGALRRRGLKSTFVRDEWLILDSFDREVGLIQEDSTGLALLRRFVEAASLIFPQKYSVQVGGRQVATFRQNFNPFVYKLTVDLTDDPQRVLDRRLAMAAAILLAAVEGKQQG